MDTKEIKAVDLKVGDEILHEYFGCGSTEGLSPVTVEAIRPYGTHMKDCFHAHDNICTCGYWDYSVVVDGSLSYEDESATVRNWFLKTDKIKIIKPII